MNHADFLKKSRAGKRISVNANDLRELKEIAETAAEKLGKMGSFPKTILGIAVAVTKVIKGAEEC